VYVADREAVTHGWPIGRRLIGHLALTSLAIWPWPVKRKHRVGRAPPISVGQTVRVGTQSTADELLGTPCDEVMQVAPIPVVHAIVADFEPGLATRYGGIRTLGPMVRSFPGPARYALHP
jgi:hypothetical protein